MVPDIPALDDVDKLFSQVPGMVSENIRCYTSDRTSMPFV